MTTLMLLAFSSALRFPGGSEQALADAASTDLKRPITMLAVGPEKVRPFEFHYEDEKDVRRLFRVKTGFNVTPGGGLFPPGWPVGVGRIWDKASYQRQFSSLSSPAVFKEGRITVNTKEGEAATLDDVANMGLDRPLVWPEFYGRVRLRLSVTRATVPQLLAAVADATGTRLIVEKATYRLVTDPKQYRPRALAMWGVIGAEGRRLNDPEKIADAEYMAIFLPSTSDGLIVHGIDDPKGNYAETWNPGTSVHTAAWRRAAAMFRTNTPEVQELFQKVARASDPIYGYIRDTGMVRIGYRNVESHEFIEL